MTPTLKIELRLPMPEFSEPTKWPDPMDEIHTLLTEILIRLRAEEPHWGGYYFGQVRDKAKNHIGYFKLSLVMED